MNRSDLQRLALLRIADAQALLASRRAVDKSGAYYLAGYAVECALKACIARKTLAEDWPPPAKEVQAMYTHNLADLVKLAGLQTDLENERRQNAIFNRYWAEIKDWNEQSRYLLKTRQEARLLVTAIGDPTNGVLRWIQQYW